MCCSWLVHVSSYMKNEQINLIVKRYYEIKDINSLQFRDGHRLKISFN